MCQEIVNSRGKAGEYSTCMKRKAEHKRRLKWYSLQVSVQAELYGNAVHLQRRVMDELLQHLFSAYNTFLSDRLEGK